MMKQLKEGKSAYGKLKGEEKKRPRVAKRKRVAFLFAFLLGPGKE